MDTGVGIDPYKIKNILEPFRQESEGLSRSFEGMGLGLSIAKQLIDILNGEIKIKSEIGSGTTVSLKFPIIESNQDFTKRIGFKRKTIYEEEFRTTNGKQSILMVEDNDNVRLLFNKYLDKEFSVREALDGVSAIVMAELFNYDIILMDINLGAGIDGIETFKQIRKLPNCKDIPVIALTAYGTLSDRPKFLDLGFCEYIQKPVDRKDLISTIKKLIQQNT
jgi:CheY-like chemotaxis protein